MKRFVFCATFAFVCVFCHLQSVNAASITLQVSGVVEQVTDPSELLSPALTVGVPFVAVLKYGSDTTDSSPEDSSRGEYRQLPSTSKLTIDVGGHHFETYPDSAITVFAADGVPIGFDEQGQPISFGDGIGINYGEMFGPIVFDTCFAALQLHDSSGTALDSDAFPFTIDPDSFDSRQLILTGVAGGTREFGSNVINLVLRADVVSAVPEPATAVHVGAVVVAWLVVAGRRRMTQSVQRRLQKKASASATVGVTTCLLP